MRVMADSLLSASFGFIPCGRRTCELPDVQVAYVEVQYHKLLRDG